jgi:hypothetical protein
MEWELGNERLGQYYTPYDVARLMAQTQIDSAVEQVQRDGFADLYKPTCGAGAFIVALSQAMLEHGLNPQTQLHVTAEDTALRAMHMIYVHLVLLHIPAVVRRRDVPLRLDDPKRGPADRGRAARCHDRAAAADGGRVHRRLRRADAPGGPARRPARPSPDVDACNGLLRQATKDEVAAQLKHGTQRSYDVFAQCTDSGRTYWKGAHHDQLEAIVERALAEHG